MERASDTDTGSITHPAGPLTRLHLGRHPCHLYSTGTRRNLHHPSPASFSNPSSLENRVPGPVAGTDRFKPIRVALACISRHLVGSSADYSEFLIPPERGQQARTAIPSLSSQQSTWRNNVGRGRRRRVRSVNFASHLAPHLVRQTNRRFTRQRAHST